MSQGQIWLKRKFPEFVISGEKNAFFIITVKGMVYYII